MNLSWKPIVIAALVVAAPISLFFALKITCIATATSAEVGLANYYAPTLSEKVAYCSGK